MCMCLQMLCFFNWPVFLQADLRLEDMRQSFVTTLFFTFKLETTTTTKTHQVLLAAGKRNQAKHLHIFASQAQVVPTLNPSFELSKSLQVTAQRRRFLWAPEAFLSLHLCTSVKMNKLLQFHSAGKHDNMLSTNFSGPKWKIQRGCALFTGNLTLDCSVKVYCSVTAQSQTQICSCNGLFNQNRSNNGCFMCKCYIKLCSQHLKCDHLELLLAECCSLSKALQANAALCRAVLRFQFSL